MKYVYGILIGLVLIAGGCKSKPSFVGGKWYRDSVVVCDGLVLRGDSVKADSFYIKNGEFYLINVVSLRTDIEKGAAISIGRPMVNIRGVRVFFGSTHFNYYHPDTTSRSYFYPIGKK